MTHMLYIWKDSQIIKHDWDHGKFPRECADLPCLDSEGESEKGKYGYFFYEGGTLGWAHTPYHEFPTDFQMALLLLGIT